MRQALEGERLQVIASYTKVSVQLFARVGGEQRHLDVADRNALQIELVAVQIFQEVDDLDIDSESRQDQAPYHAVQILADFLLDPIDQWIERIDVAEQLSRGPQELVLQLAEDTGQSRPQLPDLRRYA